MRRSFFHLAPAAVVCALIVSMSGCGGETVSKPASSAGASEPVAVNDGALSIAAFTGFVDAVGKGQGDVACASGTQALQQSLVADAARFDLVGKKADCTRAVEALAEHGRAPAPVTSFVVGSALDDTTDLIVKRAGAPDEAVHLLSREGLWLIDSIGTAPAPITRANKGTTRKGG